MSTTSTDYGTSHGHVEPEFEELGLPVYVGKQLNAKGGYPRFRIGQKLRWYTILRKLGWGQHSSSWLACDERSNDYVAIKALTGYATEVAQLGSCHEPDALRKVSDPSSPRCLSLLESFQVPGAVPEDGEHMCLVTPLYGGDIGTLLPPATTESREILPLPLCKRILLHVLYGLAHAHAHGVIHADLKIDNIFFSTPKTTAELKAWMDDNPAQCYPSVQSVGGTVQPVVSQPLPPPSLSEACRATYVLGDFSTACTSKPDEPRDVYPEALRPPEVLMHGLWDSSVDMWAFGILIFELICNQNLFKWQEPPPHLGGNNRDCMLMQMIEFSGQDFEAEFYRKWLLSPHFFVEDTGVLTLLSESHLGVQAKKIEIAHRPLEEVIEKYMKGIMSHEQIMEMKRVILRCLRLDPAKRVTAQELLKDDWWVNVERAQCP